MYVSSLSAGQRIFGGLARRATPFGGNRDPLGNANDFVIIVFLHLTK
jgi:hypothetical protein